jgi:hypothetical protein
VAARCLGQSACERDDDGRCWEGDFAGAEAVERGGLYVVPGEESQELEGGRSCGVGVCGSCGGVGVQLCDEFRYADAGTGV